MMDYILPTFRISTLTHMYFTKLSRNLFKRESFPLQTNMTTTYGTTRKSQNIKISEKNRKDVTVEPKNKNPEKSK